MAAITKKTADTLASGAALVKAQAKAQSGKTSNEKALNRTASETMTSVDREQSTQNYGQQIADAALGDGSAAEKQAALDAIAKKQSSSPYATGIDAYDEYANTMLQNYTDAKKSMGNASAAAEEALQMQIEQAIAQMERQKPEVEQSYQDAQRQAYIQQMQSKRNLGQQMAAAGLTGGATESSMLNLENNYGNTRAAYTRDRDQALRDIDYQIGDTQAQGAISAAQLEAQYQQMLAEMAQSYGSNLATAKLNAQLQAAEQEAAAKQLEADLAQQQWERDFQIQQADRDWQLAMDELQWEKDKYAQSQASKTASGSGYPYTGANGDWLNLGEDQTEEEASVEAPKPAYSPTATDYNGILNATRNAVHLNGATGGEVASYLMAQYNAGRLTGTQMVDLANQYGAADALATMLQ